jgi:DNA-binding SARP family transcriptional activator
MDRKSARHNLHTTIYHLRHSLEPTLEHGPDSIYIQRRGDLYLLAGGRTHWLDVEAFEHKLADARHVDGHGRSARLYRQAIALYRGEFLADLDAYQLDCWIDREHYRRLYVDALQGLGDVLLRQDRDDQARALYRQILAEDPCCETATRTLMRMALCEGNRTKALSLYTQLEETLQRTLDVEPSQETRHLRQQARSGD